MKQNISTIWHFPIMILFSIIIFFVIIRIVIGKQNFIEKRTSIVLLSFLVVVIGMLFGKYGQQWGLKWWIYYPVPMLMTVLLPPLILKMDFKKSNANKSTTTQNLKELEGVSGNIFESVVIIAKRAEQINEEVREELHEKLEEFATSTETLEEIFDNKEQIEVSKFYENLPKPHSMATEEWKEDKIYFRYPEVAAAEKTA